MGYIKGMESKNPSTKRTETMSDYLKDLNERANSGQRNAAGETFARQDAACRKAQEQRANDSGLGTIYTLISFED